MPICSPAEEGPISEKQVYATRSGEPMCHGAARKARAKKLKHMQAHERKCCGGQVCGTAGTPATCGCSSTVGSQQKPPERSQVLRIVRQHSSIRPLTNRRTHRSHLLRHALNGTRKASRLWAKTSSKALSSDEWTQSKVVPGTLYHASRVVMSTCHGDDVCLEASLDGLGKFETTPRNHFVTKRLAVMVPRRDC